MLSPPVPIAMFFSRAAHNFRRRFQFANAEVLHWFPGHMGKGMKMMEQKLKDVDCVVEVHDARIPLSGRNPKFYNTVLGMKPHILVLNKMDLAVRDDGAKIKDKLMREHGVPNIIFTNAKNRKCPGVRRVIPKAVELINSSDRFNREGIEELCVMIIGVPNVGKSTLINNLRNIIIKKKNAAPMGPKAGVTRAVQTRIKVCEDPPVFLLDTPGISTPNVPDLEVGMRLALCGTMQDHLVGATVIADYLLYRLNKQRNFSYLKLLGLDEPTDNIAVALTKGAIKLEKFTKTRTHEGYKLHPNMTEVADIFIRSFREGDFGPVMLDLDLLED